MLKAEVRGQGGRKQVRGKEAREAKGLLQHLHDLRLVCAPAQSVGEAVVHRGLGQLGIAFFEYVLQVPANRIGFRSLNLGQLKILQEVITLAVFVPFAILYMKQPFKTDFVWAGVCLLGAVYFMFRT